MLSDTANTKKHSLIHTVIKLTEKLIVITHYKNEKHNKGQYIGKIRTCPFGEFESVSGICFLNEVVPAPAVAGDTEQKINKASKWKQVVGDNKIFQILNGAACAKWLNAAPYIETKYARHG